MDRPFFPCSLNSARKFQALIISTISWEYRFFYMQNFLSLDTQKTECATHSAFNPQRDVKRGLSTGQGMPEILMEMIVLLME